MMTRGTRTREIQAEEHRERARNMSTGELLLAIATCGCSVLLGVLQREHIRRQHPEAFQ